MTFINTFKLKNVYIISSGYMVPDDIIIFSSNKIF